MVVEGSEITLGVRIQSVFEQFGKHGTLDFKRTSRDVHHLIETLIEIFFVACEICYTGHIDSYYAYRSGAFAATEVTARFFTQFAKVKAQSATHTADVAGLHIAVYVVGEVRSAVLCCHFKQKFVVFSIRPVESFGYGIGRDGVLETSAVSVAVYHYFDKRLVYHVHFLFAILVLERHFLSAHYTVEFGKVVGHHPVQRYVGEGCLRTPATGRIDAVNEGFDALFNLIVA